MRLPTVYRTQQTASSWRSMTDDDLFVKACVAHVPMFALLFGDRIARWACEWSDMHSAKTGAIDLDARLAEFAERTRSICFGEGAHALHYALMIMPSDYCVSVAYAWLMEHLRAAQERVSSLCRFQELQDLVRHRLLPRILRHCVFARRKKRPREDAPHRPPLELAEWVLRATTIDDPCGIGSAAAVKSTPVFPLRTLAMTRPPPEELSFDQVTFFLPKLRDALRDALLAANEPALARWAAHDLALRDTVSFRRYGNGGGIGGGRCFLLGDPRHDGREAGREYDDDKDKGGSFLSTYTFVDPSSSPPAFAARAFVCFCDAHVLPKLQRLTLFRAVVAPHKGHRKGTHWADAAGVDWLPTDTCLRASSVPPRPQRRTACFRAFRSCRPSWNRYWRARTDAAVRAVTSTAATRTVADTLFRITPVFHACVFVRSEVVAGAFALAPRAVFARGKIARVAEGSLGFGGGPLPSSSASFLQACLRLRHRERAQPKERCLRAGIPEEDGEGDNAGGEDESMFVEYAVCGAISPTS